MVIAVDRDRGHSLKLTLESEARTISIAVGIAVGVLLLATVVILQAHLFRKLGRYVFGIPTQIPNQTEDEVWICTPLPFHFTSAFLPRFL